VGKLYTWGYNHDGQLGQGSDAEYIPIPTVCNAMDQKKVSLIACGGSHALILTGIFITAVVCDMFRTI